MADDDNNQEPIVEKVVVLAHFRDAQKTATSTPAPVTVSRVDNSLIFHTTPDGFLIGLEKPPELGGRDIRPDIWVDTLTNQTLPQNLIAPSPQESVPLIGITNLGDGLADFFTQSASQADYPKPYQKEEPSKPVVPTPAAEPGPIRRALGRILSKFGHGHKPG